MPVTIGTVKSTVKLTEGRGSLTEEQMEALIEAVIARLKAEEVFEEKASSERKIPDRQSPTGY
jgi:hypothetical protein